MKGDRKRTIIFVIILLVLSLGIGYAFLTTTLTIDGLSDIDSAIWDVHWDNVQVENGSITGSQVISPATIINNGTTVSYHIKFNEPGDVYIFSIDAVNAGTLDAMIEDISISINGSTENEIPDYLVFDYIYSSHIQVQKYDYLRASETIKYFFLIQYKDDIDQSQLPSNNESCSIVINITYSQANSYAREIGYYLYSTNRNREIGDYFNISYSENLENLNLGENMAAYRYLIRDMYIFETDLVFKTGGEYYYLYGVRGIHDETNDSYSYLNRFFNKNEELAYSLFNSNECEYEDGNLTCHDSEKFIFVGQNGVVRFSDNSNVWSVTESGMSTWSCVQC